MSKNLYLWSEYREFKKDQLRLYIETFSKKVIPIFGDVEKHAEELSQRYYEEMMSKSICYDELDSIDPSIIADYATDLGIEFYESNRLMKYNSILMCISTMYQYWEQQVRKFLYDEMSHDYEIDFKNFCSNGIGEITECFKQYNFDLESLSVWETITELRLLCNVIKHGDGGAAKKLKKLCPKFFDNEYGLDIDLLDLYNTTLLNTSLNVNEDDFVMYGKAVMAFWDELPERMLNN